MPFGYRWHKSLQAYHQFESRSLRHPANMISYLELQRPQKLGRFPAISQAENSQPSSNKGLSEAGEPNFLRIFEPAKSV
jgi:hypothetical protein